MSTIQILFACGCDPQDVDADKVAAPSCLACGETRIARTVGAPRPRLVGHGRSPLITSQALEAIPVKLAPHGPLKLKPKKKPDDTQESTPCP